VGDSVVKEQDAARSPLRIEPYHRSEKSARDYVQLLVEQFGVTNFKTKLTGDKLVAIPTSDRPMQVNLRREVFQTRKTGVPPIIQPLVDASDQLMPPPFSLGMIGDVPGVSFDINVRVGTFEAKISGAGIHEAPVVALADDVLHFRRQIVEAAASHDLPQMARCYRTYLQTCISLVDAFLGHAAFAVQQLGSPKASSAAFKRLTETVRFEDRLDAWCELCGQPPGAYKSSKSWSDLQILRRERNRYVHPSEPIYTLGIDDVVKVLNLCRDGVGGTLVHFRKMSGLSPNMSYIQKVLTAPIITRSA
jgi:hypothetical protein